MSSGSYVWASECKDGVWTYGLDEAFAGLKAALSGISGRESVAVAGVSGMMHGSAAYYGQN